MHEQIRKEKGLVSGKKVDVKGAGYYDINGK